MGKVKVHRRSDKVSLPVAAFLSTGSGMVVPPGYHLLTEAPEVAAAVWQIAGMISSVPLKLYRNTPNGDERVRDELAKKLDISPWSLGTRATLIDWIVFTMCTKGEAFVLPSTTGGLLDDLTPMPDAVAQPRPDGKPYEVVWRGLAFRPDEVLHFRLRPDARHPWKGAAPTVQLQPIVDSIMQTAATKLAYMSSEYKPPLIVAVHSDADLSTDAQREEFAERYLSRSNPGAPMVIPSDLLDVKQAKPLSLTDLAIKDGVELDKKAVASLIGVPGYMVGVGGFNEAEHNNFVRTKLVTICKIIEQELTKKLLLSPDRYWRFATLRLYSYGMQTLAGIGKDAYACGLMTGNEVRNWMELSPMKGLDKLIMLENYIPAEKIGDQNKLKEGDGQDGL